MRVTKSTAREVSHQAWITVSCVALFIVYTHQSEASSCRCDSPPGGEVSCESDQMAFCAIDGDQCITRCTRLSPGLAGAKGRVQLLQSLGVDGISQESPSEARLAYLLHRRIDRVEFIPDDTGFRADFRLDNGDRASLQGLNSKSELSELLGVEVGEVIGGNKKYIRAWGYENEGLQEMR